MKILTGLKYWSRNLMFTLQPKWILIISFLFITAYPVYAISGNIYYVNSNATGTQTGLDWNNALLDLPVNLERGGTYYIAGGIYSGHTFNDTTNGSEQITIVKASSLDHGTNTGWNNSYAQTNAIFTSPLIFLKPFYVIDGVTGKGKSGHGIVVDMSNTTGPNKAIDIRAGNLRLSHIMISWPNRDDSKFISTTSSSCGIEANTISPYLELSNIHISDVFIKEVPGYPFRLIRVKNFILENSVTQGMHSDPTHHASLVIVRTAPSNQGIIRYNWFEDGEGTGGIVFYDNVIHEGWEIYSNVFYQTNSTLCEGFGMGVVASNNHPSDPGLTVRNLKIYNNTIVGVKNNGGINLYTNGDNAVAYNNIFYNTQLPAVFSGVTFDYNYYSRCTGAFAWNTGYGRHENPWDYNTGGSIIKTDPFVGSTSENFSLSGPLVGYPALTLAAPYSIDILGNNRDLSPVWDRGAYKMMKIPKTPLIQNIGE